MKYTTISVSLLGEKYTLSGNVEMLRRALSIFQEVLEKVRREHQGREISTHRLAVMTGMALASELVHLQEREKKKAELLTLVQTRVKSLISKLNQHSVTTP
ncbi:MAG: cell division protein ZapA [Candidatus Omnitrophota bacterium]